MLLKAMLAPNGLIQVSKAVNVSECTFEDAASFDYSPANLRTGGIEYLTVGRSSIQLAIGMVSRLRPIYESSCPKHAT